MRYKIGDRVKITKVEKDIPSNLEDIINKTGEIIDIVSHEYPYEVKFDNTTEQLLFAEDELDFVVNSCEYCNGKKVLLEGNNNLGFFLKENIMIIIEQNNINESFIFDNIDIDYCPKCGRNLCDQN